MRKMFVTAMLPPGNILAGLNEVKAKLFSEFGFASLYALPSMVPISVTSNSIEQPASHAVIRQSEVVTVSGALIKNGYIVMPVEPAGICNHIRNQLVSVDSGHVSSKSGPDLPTVEALILGMHEFPEDVRVDNSLREFLKSEFVGSFRWKRSELVCFKVSSNGKPWWTQVQISYRWKYPLKSTAVKP